MQRAFYCNVYISRPTRCTNSYIVSLFIITYATCFGLFIPTSGVTFGAVHRNWYKPVRLAVASQQPDVPAYTNFDIQLQNVAPDDGLKSPKHVEHLMINKNTL